MPEDNQIQTGFQPEIQANPQIQQNNLVQNQQQIQESNQQIIQQDNSVQNQQPIQGITQQIIQENMQQNIEKPIQTIYYHPSWLTKILSGVYRFIGMTLVWSGLWNFSLIGTDDLSFFKILYVGGIITLCGIGYVLLGRLLYNTKSKVHLGLSMLCAFIVNIMFYWILKTFIEERHWIDNDIFESFGVILVIFSLIYFSILTIRWIIKYRKFKKKGIINSKYLDSTPSKKKVGIITTIVLFFLIIINLIYGKIQWSKITEIDESIFAREEHQNKLPDEEDALVQLRKFYDSGKGKVIDILDSYYFYEFSDGSSNYLKNNKDITWKSHIDECIVINSGGNEYCGTWIWNKNTLDRVLNNYYYIGYNSYFEDYINSDGYFSIDGEKVTIFEYIQMNEQKIRATFQELDRIASLDYYLPDDEILDLIPPYFQGFSRASMVMLQYYIYQKDWDMVMFIIKLNYKIIDILNDTGSFVYQLVAIALQNIVDSSINSYIKLFPNDFKEDLSQRYSIQIHDRDELIAKTIKGEYVVWNGAKKGNIMNEVGKNIPSVLQFLFHFPFYSEKSTNNLMDNHYYSIRKSKENNFECNVCDNVSNNIFLYNLYGLYPLYSIAPRMTATYDRLDRALYHKDVLIKNLESGKYDARFSEKDWDSYEYERNRMPTDNELNK